MFFDQQTGILNLDEQIYSHTSFQKIMQDQIVTDEEIVEQSNLVEMGVLYTISQIKQLQDIQR